MQSHHRTRHTLECPIAVCRVGRGTIYRASSSVGLGFHCPMASLSPTVSPCRSECESIGDKPPGYAPYANRHSRENGNPSGLKRAHPHHKSGGQAPALRGIPNANRHSRGNGNPSGLRRAHPHHKSGGQAPALRGIPYANRHSRGNGNPSGLRRAHPHHKSGGQAPALHGIPNGNRHSRGNGNPSGLPTTRAGDKPPRYADPHPETHPHHKSGGQAPAQHGIAHYQPKGGEASPYATRLVHFGLPRAAPPAACLWVTHAANLPLQFCLLY